VGDAWRNDEGVAAEVEERLRGWTDCTGRGDLAALRGYLHQDFVYVSVFGRRYDRDGYIALVGSLVPGAHYDFRSVRARVLGDVAEVDGEHVTSSGPESGEDLTAGTRFTACWVRNGPGGRWVALTHHGTRYDPSVDPGAASRG
jgi:ketosteroid isomerase-like protein